MLLCYTHQEVTLAHRYVSLGQCVKIKMLFYVCRYKDNVLAPMRTSARIQLYYNNEVNVLHCFNRLCHFQAGT